MDCRALASRELERTNHFAEATGKTVVIAVRNKGLATELIVLAFSVASLFVALLADLGWITIEGSLRFGLYPFYSIVALGGWIAGNVYVSRSEGHKLRRPLFLFYLMIPLGPIFLMRAMAPMAEQQVAPLVPLFAYGVYAVFFMVPVTFRASAPKRRQLDLRTRPQAPDEDQAPDRSAEASR